MNESAGKLRAELGEWKLDAFVTTALPNVYYLTGFTGSNAVVIVTRDRTVLLTDPRYSSQAPQECSCDVRVVKGPLLNGLALFAQKQRVRRLGFERNRISFQEHAALAAALPATNLIATDGVVEDLRAVKSADEIAAIRKSVRLNSQALEAAMKEFRAGMTELELAAEIDYRMRQLGADGTAFDTIVASGPRSALPHAHPSAAAIGARQLLLVDMGARVAGYCSDMTRTFAVGAIRRKDAHLYRAVLESQLAAIDAVKPGVLCDRVDRAARDVLRKHDMDKAFIHSTGHGLGVEIHERPRLGRKEKTSLQPGMVVTIEPGAYFAGQGGVRIEDTVLVTETGCEVLTPTGKDLTVL